jgi:hypothetical protein
MESFKVNDEPILPVRQAPIIEDLTVPENIKLQPSVARSDNPPRYRWSFLPIGASKVRIEKSTDGWNFEVLASDLVFLLMALLVGWLRH